LKTIRAILIVSAALTLLACCAVAQPTPGSIEVHVSVSTPAVVVLMSGGQVKAVSVVPKAKNGCLLQDIMPGRYTLTVSAPFYASITRAVTVRDGAETEVTVAMSKLTDRDFKTRGLVVGFVKDANGTPVVNATLVLMKGNRPVGATRPENATGVYELEWYAPGTYKVIVTAPGFNTAVYSGQTITAGASTWLDVVLQAE